MKNLLIITALLISSIIYAQDTAFISSINKADITTAKTLANDIVLQTSTKYKLLKTTEKANRYRLIYIPETLTPEAFKQSMSYDKALIIDFNIIQQVPGIKTLKLSKIKANYNDVFPTWKKYFNSNADATKTPKDYNSKRMTLADYKFVFNKEMGFKTNVWSIQNQS